MIQILQHLRSGRLELAELPDPQLRSGSVLIQTRASVISAGTERMLVEFSRASLLQKARQQPDRVRQVLDKMRTDGLLPTLEAVFRKLDEPLPLGYCNAGVVLETGRDVHDLSPGDRVASNGPHAQLVCVPRNLCARIPDGVTDEHAAFTVLSAIALQGIRLADPTFGERFAVFGVGLLGLLTVQLLRASGCQVLAVDPDTARLQLAERLGARTVDLSAGGDPIAAAKAWTADRGVDGVLITAAAETDEIVHQAAQGCRKRGRIVLVGVVGLDLRRSDFFEKELTFQVSCSYGPGRYDERYEQLGQDYPYGFVRWTEQRNFGAVLAAMHNGTLRVDPLITDRLPFDRAIEAYDKIRGDANTLGVVLRYSPEVKRTPSVAGTVRPSSAVNGVVAGVIGAGNFAKGVLIPALAATSAELAYVASRTPASARHAAAKFGAGQAVSDHRLVLDDRRVNAVFIVVGHDQHARFACEALAAGKHVFVEKPLALDVAQLGELTRAVAAAPGLQLAVGYNRRFSAHTQKARALLAARSGPLCMSITVNAGEIPSDHWIQDAARGGGRIIGEACHFIDLLSYLAGCEIRTVGAQMVGPGPAVREDKMTIVLGFADGSLGTVHYFANGPRGYPKETLECFADGRALRVENFRVTRGFGYRSLRRFRTARQDKGHRAELAAFVDRVRHGGEPLMPFDGLLNVSLASIAAVRAARERAIVEIASIAGEVG
ncbi:MAG TPA: bi-domain-containing oxidoreductase [Candidatus Polarisedimenticolaceae bacterium]|nr:bi-domain-containing oxidoreductase [Candidatus Polarisedimenticolaceae bacterium]